MMFLLYLQIVLCHYLFFNINKGKDNYMMRLSHG